MAYPVDIAWHARIGPVSAGMVPSTGFPLVDLLPSPLSAPVRTGLFEGFPGTMRPSDFLGPCIVGVRPQTSRRGPSRYETARPRISRVPRRLLPCMLGVSDRAGSHHLLRERRDGWGLPLLLTTSAPQSG